ncbi:MAG: hypothetical protein RMJ38_02500 [candidate division WOR-3 bacterium]|nr:hypothetical protein [candidate division WOR-3 bacterium]MDW8150297.1 hypothetical protein [candidate division WOR-3 bacterium]
MYVIGYYKLLWFNYSSVSCYTCHKLPVLKISDTLFIVGSYHFNGKLNPLILAFDTSLNVKWYRSYSHNAGNLVINDMSKVNDTLVAIVGGHGNFSNCVSKNCSFLGLFNLRTKNFIWSKYRNSNTLGDMPGMGIITHNSWLISVFEDSCSSVVLKTSLNGNIIWRKRYSLNGACDKVMKISRDGNNYIILLIRNSGQNNDIALMKIDSDGNVVWSKGYNFGAHEIGQNIIVDNDGYVVVGTRCLTAGPLCGSQLGDDDILIFKTDFNGNMKWSNLYSSNMVGWSSEDRGYSITIESNEPLPSRCLDIGQPVDPITGQIKIDFSQIYSTCTPCVRVNFILAQAWSSVNDQNFINTYNQIINNFVNRDIKVYALVGHEAVKTFVGNLLRYENPINPSATNNWINEYTDNFLSIVLNFRDRVKVFESFNEPNGYIINNTYLVHPKWFAKILQDIYTKVKINANVRDVLLISGPLLTDDLNKGNGYLDSTYIYGKNIWSWNTIKNKTGSYPIDGIGMHVYVLLNSTNSQAIRNAMLNNINLIWDKIILHEGSNTQKKIWISEFGWESSAIGQSGQAHNMTTGFNTLNGDSRVAIATWFQLKDFVVDNTTKTWGIYQIDNNPKQAYFKFRELNCQRNYIVSGFTRVNSSKSYPIVMKINGSNGNIVWSRGWINIPTNSNSNHAKNVISYGLDRFFLVNFFSTTNNSVNSLVVLKESINSTNKCTQPVNFTQTVSNPYIYNINPLVLNDNSAFYNLNLTPYNVSINSGTSCTFTSVLNDNSIKDCNYSLKILGNLLEIEPQGEIHLTIYKVYIF